MHFSLATNFFAILKHHSLPPGPISSYVPFHHRQCNQIYWTLGNFTKPVATISLPKSPTFLGNFCKGEKIFNVSSEIIFGQLLQTFGDFYLVTLLAGNTTLQEWSSLDKEELLACQITSTFNNKLGCFLK